MTLFILLWLYPCYTFIFFKVRGGDCFFLGSVSRSSRFFTQLSNTFYLYNTTLIRNGGGETKPYYGPHPMSMVGTWRPAVRPRSDITASARLWLQLVSPCRPTVWSSEESRVCVWDRYVKEGKEWKLWNILKFPFFPFFNIPIPHTYATFQAANGNFSLEHPVIAGALSGELSILVIMENNK